MDVQSLCSRLSDPPDNLVGMPPTLPSCGCVRPASVVNAEIRALWSRARGTLSEVEAALYERLLIEWAVAVRAEVDRAA